VSPTEGGEGRDPGERAGPSGADADREWWERVAGSGRDESPERWERWAMRRRADGGRGWGGPDAPWAHGGPPWGPGGRPPWRRNRGRGFGCLFGLVFLVVLIAFVTVGVTILSSVLTAIGPLPAVIVGILVVAMLAGLAGGLRRSARTLDSLVDATRRVEDGDYSVRVDVPERGLRPVRQLVRGFDTMVERLEVDERQRRSLLADVSHELRTPLSVISGNLEAMIDGVHPIDESHLAAILDETRVMERLIDDLRTVALSEAGTLTLHREPTDPDVLIAEVVRSFEAAAGTAGVTVTAEVGEDLPILDVDPVRLREVLANLVANAIRHTPAGGTVVIRGEVSGDRLVLRVADSGSGIDPDVLPHVFDRFVKGAGSGGSGLGLAIARHLVAAHGGTLEVEATGSAGTTFRVSLPLSSEEP
jgi:two-component system, OmpR family, sensor histidine kinase BaeS